MTSSMASDIINREMENLDLLSGSSSAESTLSDVLRGLDVRAVIANANKFGRRHLTNGDFDKWLDVGTKLAFLQVCNAHADWALDIQLQRLVSSSKVNVCLFQANTLNWIGYVLFYLLRPLVIFKLGLECSTYAICIFCSGRRCPDLCETGVCFQLVYQPLSPFRRNEWCPSPVFVVACLCFHVSTFHSKPMLSWLSQQSDVIAGMNLFIYHNSNAPFHVVMQNITELTTGKGGSFTTIHPESRSSFFNTDTCTIPADIICQVLRHYC